MVTINISGVCGTGKSAIASLIADTLNTHGLMISEIIDPDLSGVGFIPVDKDTLKLIVDKTQVKIVVTQLHRFPIKGC